MLIHPFDPDLSRSCTSLTHVNAASADPAHSQTQHGVGHTVEGQHTIVTEARGPLTGNKEGTMTTGDKRVELGRVACEICLKEVPRSEATVPEATDYVAYFCGLDCYEKWKSQSGETAREPEKPGS